jgi:hypothetical protein
VLIKLTSLSLLVLFAIAMKLSSPQPINACPQSEIIPELIAWVSPIPIAPALALPPGEPSIPTPKPTDHTHVLHIELRLHNTTRDSHNAEVVDASWSQNNRTHRFAWMQQPDLSPLNRFSTIEHRHLQTNRTEPITVTLKLKVDGSACTLTGIAEVPGRR